MPGRLAVFCSATSAPALLLNGILLFSPVKGASNALRAVAGDAEPLLAFAAAFLSDLPVLAGLGTLVARWEVPADVVDELSWFAHIPLAGSSSRIEGPLYALVSSQARPEVCSSLMMIPM